MKSYLKYILLMICTGFGSSMFGQQDPQFTQYMYNTLSVNPAYAGSRGHLSILGMYRTQWVGLNGAPTSQVLAIDGPVGNNVGLGVILTNDELGPANETFFDANFAYTIRLNGDDKRLSFGLKGGGRLFNVDFSKGLFEDQTDVAFQNNIENKFFPTIGAGIYYHTDKGYFGIAIPNFFSEEHYDGSVQKIATERLHYFITGGRVFELNQDVLFKPAVFVKWVPGAPIIADLSANFLIKETLTLGAAYRWDDSFSGLLGIDISPKFHVGYAYDFTTTELQNYNNGTHEIFVRFELKSLDKRLKSPRFY
ncbi:MULTISPECIES: PorP/SprF family type IX secretion system membrane protein [Croceitalea]|uniref:Type IX secretion system membrane protein PorP/SprF n=1 Tax=Croceitalea vernalis TaxID=3075599 RepID=A0ABU3BG83_9FLAO|nr:MULTISPECIES: type IX secretion system membrane protein PorP/SprF [unclassified Croceitalea]MDT0539393.1 type IX secretion system membrane protein PorP/SprF [Croceitalea sp. P059]MDT0621186.1 type IX secretion system membrane protein PorP/SprF [Croceitalea sp. P007]